MQNHSTPSLALAFLSGFRQGDALAGEKQVKHGGKHNVCCYALHAFASAQLRVVGISIFGT